MMHYGNIELINGQLKESRWQLMRVGLGDGGIEQKGKRTHGHGQYCGDCWGEGCTRDYMMIAKIQYRLNQGVSAKMQE